MHLNQPICEAFDQTASLPHQLKRYLPDLRRLYRPSRLTAAGQDRAFTTGSRVGRFSPRPDRSGFRSGEICGESSCRRLEARFGAVHPLSLFLWFRFISIQSSIFVVDHNKNEWMPVRLHQQINVLLLLAFFFFFLPAFPFYGLLLPSRHVSCPRFWRLHRRHCSPRCRAPLLSSLILLDLGPPRTSSCVAKALQLLS